MSKLRSVSLIQPATTLEDCESLPQQALVPGMRGQLVLGSEG